MLWSTCYSLLLMNLKHSDNVNLKERVRVIIDCNNDPTSGSGIYTKIHDSCSLQKTQLPCLFKIIASISIPFKKRKFRQLLQPIVYFAFQPILCLLRKEGIISCDVAENKKELLYYAISFILISSLNGMPSFLMRLPLLHCQWNFYFSFGHKRKGKDSHFSTKVSSKIAYIPLWLQITGY